MAFIKVGDTVINTDYIVAVELDRISISGKCCVVISVAAKGGLFNRKLRFWFDGDAASSLRDYFENPDNVTELLPSSSPRSQARQRTRQWQRIRQRREAWNDERSEPTDDPPPPTIRRRPWGPQSPDPLSAAASVEQFNPPIP